MTRKYLHRLLKLLVLLVALLLLGWVVMLSLQEGKTPWPVKGFLIILWLFIASIGVKAVLE